MDWISKELSLIKGHSPYKRPKRLPDHFKMDSNENIVLEKKFIKAIASKSLSDNDFREYPLKQFDLLFDKISKYTNTDPKNVGIGSGSDQIMDLLLSTICRGRSAITIHPTFSYFIDRCNMHNIPVRLINLSALDNSVEFGRFISESRDKEIIYIASPNNPTGNQFGIGDITNLIEASKDKLVIIDEAYVEFADYSLSGLVNRYSNLIVMRTFSKAFGLAGARIGYILANDEITSVFNQYIQLPYPLSSFSMQLAMEALENIAVIKRGIEFIKQERQRMYDRLSKVGEIRVYRSDANFLFFQTFGYFNKIRGRLAREKLLIKEFGDIGEYKGALRATIGTKNMNDSLIAAFENPAEQ